MADGGSSGQPGSPEPPVPSLPAAAPSESSGDPSEAIRELLGNYLRFDAYSKCN